MAFTDEIKKLSTERFVLARLEPAKFINDEIPSIGGNQYQGTFADTVLSKLERNGVELTKVSSPSSDGEYSFDEDTGVLTVYSTSAPSASTVFVMYFYLFYASCKDVRIGQDVTSGTERLWEGRITRTPTFKQSIRNQINIGQVTSSNTSLTIVNTDYAFNAILNPPELYSFKNKEIKVWISINDEIRSLLSGNITAVTIGENVQFNFVDNLNKQFDKPAYMGDPVEQATMAPATYPNVDPRYLNSPIPFMLGDTSPYSYTRQEDESANNVYDAVNFLSAEKTLRASNSDNTGVETTDNREWICCRMKSDQSLKTISLTLSSSTIVNVPAEGIVIDDDSFSSGTEPAGNFFEFQFTSHNLEIGDTFKYSADNPGGTSTDTYHALVCHIEPGSPTKVIAFTNYLVSHAASFDVNNISIVAMPAHVPVVIRKGGTLYYPFADKHYITSVTALSSGNKLVKITFVDDMEEFTGVTNDSLLSNAPVGLDERVVAKWSDLLRNLNFTENAVAARMENLSGADVHFVCRTTGGDNNHAVNLKRLVDDAGYPTNAASFTAAESALSVDTHFTIPMVGESAIRPYLTYIQAILKSVFGIIYFDNDDDINYKLFDDAGTSVSDADDNNILLNSISVRLDYNELVTSVKLENDHVSGTTFLNDDTNDRVDNNISRYLNETEKERIIKHVLVDVAPITGATERIGKLLDYKQSSVISYIIRTATEHLNAEVNDLITLKHDIILGGSGELTDGKIIETSKNENDTELTIVDTANI